mgnify:CR=1 FL=1
MIGDRIYKLKTMVFLSIGIFVVLVAASVAYLISGTGEAKHTEARIGERTFKVEVADTLVSRAQGLSGREELKEDEGMLFLFGVPARQGFWMKDMKFSIDIIWIRGEKIVGFSENLPPQGDTPLALLDTYGPPEAADKALEINAGLVSRYGFKVGDGIIINN